MDAFCREVLLRLDAGRPLVLVTIMDQHGSAPRTAGARMIVDPDGSIAGTVGGGRYEAKAIDAALAMFGRGAAPGEAALMRYSLQGATDMDMICGGALTLLLEYIADTPDLRAVFAAGREAEEACRPFVLFARLAFGGEGACAVERFIWLPDPGAVLPPGGPDLSARLAALSGNEPRHLEHGGEQYLLEPFPRPFRLVFFGGGHVSRDTAALALHVGFRVIVAEDRPEFAAPERFPGCSTELLPSLGQEDCARLLSRLRPGPADGIVIVTRGHSHDRDALAAALDAGAGYIGMIGSKSKRAAVYGSLRQAGVLDEALAAVHSPIGLSIGAQTPAEIAVSIVAELIAWRKAVLDGRAAT